MPAIFPRFPYRPNQLRRLYAIYNREIEFSLPCELDADERLKAAKKLAEFFRDKGMVVDMNLHNPDHKNPNPHCHLMLTMRPFQKDGTFLEKKCWREYELDENGLTFLCLRFFFFFPFNGFFLFFKKGNLICQTFYILHAGYDKGIDFFDFPVHVSDGYQNRKYQRFFCHGIIPAIA